MKLFVVIFAFVVFPVRAQSPADQTAADYLAATVAFLHADYPQTVTIDNVPYQVWLRPISKDTLFPQIRTVIGTGFFVGDSVNSFLALVTASHVASQMTINSLVTLSTADDRPISFPFSKFVKGKPLSWSVSKEADVAILELAPQKEIWPHLAGHFIPISLLQDSVVAPSRDIPLITIGFPFGLGVQKRFSPVSRESKPASGLLDLPRSDTKTLATFYLLDSPSVGGFSGAPVFEFPGAFSRGGGLTVGGRLACVGLIHGTVSDETGGKFAAVVPSGFIVQLIKSAVSARK